MDKKFTNNKKEFAILVDSCCDVPEEYLKNYPIYVIPLRINYKNASFKDRVEISPETIYKNMEEEVPTTSLPAFDDVNEIFERIIQDGYTKIIAINISSNLSGTYNMVRLVSNEYTSKGIQFYHLDTKNIAIASGMYAISAAKHLKEGNSYEDTINLLTEEYGNSKVFFCVETLEYLRKGGRIGRVASLLGSVLDIRPIITCGEDGTYCIAGKERGKKRCVNKAVDLITEFVSTAKDAEIAIMYSGQVTGLDKIKEQIKSTLPHCKIQIRGQISPVLGVHVGPGLIGIAAYVIKN